MFRRSDEDDEPDFFSGPDIPERPKEEKQPDLKPEDPDYWEQDESEWEHLKPTRRSMKYWWLAGALAAVCLLLFIWFRWFSPYVDDATQYGYIETIEQRGHIFKTYEGTLLPYKALMDTTRVYEGDFRFSVPDKRVGRAIQEMQVAGQPLRLTYRIYSGSLPWRGETDIIVTAVDSVSPDSILPPGFRPEYSYRP